MYEKVFNGEGVVFHSKENNRNFNPVENTLKDFFILYRLNYGHIENSNPVFSVIPKVARRREKIERRESSTSGNLGSVIQHSFGSGVPPGTHIQTVTRVSTRVGCRSCLVVCTPIRLKSTKVEGVKFDGVDSGSTSLCLIVVVRTGFTSNCLFVLQ